MKSDIKSAGKESSYKDPYALCSVVHWTGHGDTYVRLNPEKFTSYLGEVKGSIKELDKSLDALKAKLPEKLTMEAVFGGIGDGMKKKYSARYSGLASKIKDSIKEGPAHWPEAIRTATYDILLTKRDERRETARLERVKKTKGLSALQEMSMAGFSIETGKQYVNEAMARINLLERTFYRTGNPTLDLENIGSVWMPIGDVESMRHELDDAIETSRGQYNMAIADYVKASKLMQEVKLK